MPLSGHDIEPALRLWNELDGAQARLINHSENQTFALLAPSGERYSLRVHRPGYQSRAAIESELAWLAALRRDTQLNLPQCVPGRTGQPLQHFLTRAGEPRLAVLFRFVSGAEPVPQSDLVPVFSTLGHYAAVLHGHAATWPRPVGFDRPLLHPANLLNADGPWGNWRTAPGVGAHNRALLARLEQTLRRRLDEYGTAPHRFGLIHADMRLGNLLIDGERLTLIDFDDCGFGWFIYDFAAAISFHETSPSVPALRAAWLEGYCATRALDPADLELIDTMVMLRRMALLAWIGSHADTRLAQIHMPGFADGTAQLAERYLGGAIWPHTLTAADAGAAGLGPDQC